MEGAFLQAVNLSVSASYIVLALLLIRLLIRRAPRWISCALWGLVALRLVCPFSLESALSLQPSAQTVSPAIIADEAASGPIIHSGFVVIDEPANRALDSVIRRSAQTIDAPVADAASAPSPVAAVVSVCAVLWLTGAAAMLLTGLVGYLHLRRRLIGAVRLKGDLWQSEWVDTPFVLGLFRPRIYLPFSMDRKAAAPIIAHERAHISRHDQWTKLLGYVLLSFYWFNPFMWLAYILLGRDIELACDEKAVRFLSLSGRQRYAMALLECGVNHPVLKACPLAFGEVGLKERIVYVMKYKRPALWASALAAALAIAAALCLLTVPAARAAEDAAPAGTAQPAPEPEDTEASADPSAREARYTASLSAGGAVYYTVDTALPSVPDQPLPILQVRPRDITVEEAQAMVKALFGDAPVYAVTYERDKAELDAIIADYQATLQEFYDDFDSKVEYYWDKDNGMEREFAEETARSVQADFEDRLATLQALRKTAPDTLEPTLCDWEPRPISYYSDPALFGSEAASMDDSSENIRATVKMDGLTYSIYLTNMDPNGEYENPLHHLVIELDTVDTPGQDISALSDPFTAQDVDDTLLYARRLLDDLGLEDCVIDKYMVNMSSSPEEEPLYRMTVDAVRTLEQLPVESDTNRALPFTTEQITLSFYAPCRFEGLFWEMPTEVTEVRQTDSLLSLDQAMDVFAQTAGMDLTPGYDTQAEGHINNVSLRYVRVPLPDSADACQLVPAYVFRMGGPEDLYETQSMPPVAAGNWRTCLILSAVDGQDLYAALPFTVDTNAITQLAITLFSRTGYNYDRTGFLGTVGESYDMDVSWSPQETAAVPLWSSSDESVAAVDQNGVITLLAPGDALITVDVNGCTGVCPVTVQDQAG